MKERPHLGQLLGQIVTLHFPDDTFTRGELKINADYTEPLVNGWLVNVSGRFLSLDNGTIYA